MNKINVKIKKLNKDAVIPKYAKEGDMCMDITAISIEYDSAKDCYIYHTGLAFEIPKGYGMLIYPRSSNRKTNHYMTNHVGVVDSGYRGEVLVCFKNRSKNILEYPYEVGDRVAQLCVIPYPQIEFEEVQELTDSERGTGGHGSTGN